ncbi:MAG: hypothetical protein J6U35_02480 [Clostridia bacterium]|nr:hypothetical protein [Clostridia bacterium]
MKKLIALLLCAALALVAVFSVAACEKVVKPGGNSGTESDYTSDTGSSNTGSSGDSSEDQLIYISGTVSLPESVENYGHNSSPKGEDTGVEAKYRDTEFMVTGREYVVGDDNPFVFKPRVNFVDEERQPIQEPEDWTYSYVLEIKDGEEFTAVDEDDLATYLDDVDNVKCAFDFSAEAIGKTVRLSVTPDGITEAQEENMSRFTASFAFNVIDGYNAYVGVDLAYIANSPAAVSGVEGKSNRYNEYGDSQSGWKEIRDANGLDLNPAEIKAVIFHDDIDLTVDDIAQSMLVAEGSVSGPNAEFIEGSLRDLSHVGVYHRLLNPGDSFVIEGNYFTLDAKAIPVTYDHTGTGRDIQFDSEGNIIESGVISHIQLFYFETGEFSQNLHAYGLEKEDLNETDAYAAIRNLSVIGNSPRTEGKAAQGGLILEKAEGIFFEADNIISKMMYITFFASATGGTFICKDSKVFNSFNSPVFDWAGKDMRIENCLFTNSGGPSIICTAYRLNSNYADRDGFPRIIVTDSILDNPVSGNEAWFTAVGASALVPQVKSSDALLRSYFGRTYLNPEGKMNIYAVVINDSDYKYSPAEMGVYLNINGKVLDYGHGAKDGDPTNGGEDPAYSPTLNGTLTYNGTTGDPTLETSAGGIYTNDINYQMKLALGDMINIYYPTGDLFGYLGIALEYYNL